MIIDPVEAIMKTTKGPLIPIPLPTSTSSASTSSVASIPTILPPRPEYEQVHGSGQTTLWVVFALMVLSSAIFAGLSWRVAVSRRVYHVLTTLITIIGSLSYFAMATGHGVSFHHTRIHHHFDNTGKDMYTDLYRQVFWARYIDWALTTPLILLNLGVLSGLSGAYILMAIAADLIMTLTGLFAAFGNDGTPQKWGWYAIALISYLVVLWHYGLNGRSHASAKGSKVSSFYTSIAAYTFIIWTVYPIIWAVGSGARKMSINAEVITYAVLDVLAKAGFGAWLLTTQAKLPESNVELGGFWSYGLNREGALRIGDDNEA
jgi:bacteriorhodopsin